MIRVLSVMVLALAVYLCCGNASCRATDIVGAGATFPYPVYSAWAEAYKKETGVNIAYQAIGSAAGIRQIKAGMVTFAASDIPLSADELERSNLLQFPVVLGGIVPVVNLQHIKPGQIRLDGATLADIFMGEITVWNAPQIAALNPGITLPDIPIVPVTRSDGSGTNFIFTSYLAQVSPSFKTQIGAGATVAWPHATAARGNEGVAEKTAENDGALGYVEYVYAKEHGMTYVNMIDAAGKGVTPGLASFRAVAQDAARQGDSHEPDSTSQTNATGWPIVGASFVLLPKQPQDPALAQEALRFFAWAYAKGGAIAVALDYVPVSADAVEQIEKAWAQVPRGPDGNALWPSETARVTAHP